MYVGHKWLTNIRHSIEQSVDSFSNYTEFNKEKSNVTWTIPVCWPNLQGHGRVLLQFCTCTCMVLQLLIVPNKITRLKVSKI